MELSAWEELEDLKEKLKNNELKKCDFVKQWYYEDDYSHNEIRDMQDEFVYYAKKYLGEHYKGQYAIHQGVFSVTIQKIELFKNGIVPRNWIKC